MNLSKKIDINRSTLISLKAELCRKQEEVGLAKSQQQFNKPPEKTSKKKANIWDKKSIGIDSKEKSSKEKPSTSELTEDEIEKYQKSRSALEAKARLYDELSSRHASKADLQGAQQMLLVDFKRKHRYQEREEGETDDDDNTPVGDYGDDEDWVEYTDCLGRTRRCLKTDLSNLQRQNNKLADSLGMGPPSRSPSRSRSNSPERKPRPPTPPLEQQLVSGDLQREAMREKWEQQESEMRKKEDIHYQDILFDEVRHHGVSYYGFSKDEKLRKVQQEQLSKVRAETKKQQLSAEAARAKRAQQLKARLRAAGNRKRQRQGLPPLPDSEEETVKNASDEEAEMERLLGKGKPAETADPQPLTREAQPAPAIVRPWDKHKEKHVMSQDEWNEKKRSERFNEFAPLSSQYGGFVRSERRSRSRSPRRPRSSSSSDEGATIGPLPPQPPDSKEPKFEDSILAGLSFIRKKVEDKGGN